MPLPPLVEPVAALSDTERARTARHATLAGFGELGQRRLAAAHIAVVGAGGLGSPVVLALAAAGVGTITVIDDDCVEQSNLQRQVMHRHADVGAPKTDSAVRVAADLSPETVVHAVQQRITPDNAATLLTGAHLVIDGTDTFPTRAAVASACEDLAVPLVWGVLQEFHAQVTVFWSAPPVGTSAVRLADLYPPESVGELPSCAQVGVLGALCLQVGGMMAIEAIKLVTGIGEPLLGRVVVIDALQGRQTEVALQGAAGEEADERRDATAAAAPAEPGSFAPAIAQLTVAETVTAQASGATMIDVREPSETATGAIEGAVLIPLAELLADPARAGSGPVVVICQVGMRAERAAVALQRAGIEASVLAGGMNAWTARTVAA